MSFKSHSQTQNSKCNGADDVFEVRTMGANVVKGDHPKSADVSRNSFLTNDQAMQQKFMGGSSYGCPATCPRHLQSFKVPKNDGGF